jgi:hypothetical protein
MVSQTQRELLSQQRGYIALATASLLGLAAISVVPVGWLPKCPIHALTGLLCPGCGIQRAASALLHGDLSSAVQYNQLIFALPLFFGAAILSDVKKWNWLRSATIVAAVLTMVLFTILRNVE